MYLLAAIAARRDLRSGERVLIVDDDALFDERVVKLFGALGVYIDRCTGSDAALTALSSGKYAVLLTHEGHGGTRGLELVCQVYESYPGVGAVLLGTGESMERVTPAIQKGVFDFMTRDFEPAALLEHLSDALRRALAGAAAAPSTPAMESGYARVGTARPLDIVRDVLVGDSPELVQARAVLHAATNDDAPVSICGELGTEKLGVARLLHDLSVRRDEPFVIAAPVTARAESASAGLRSQLAAAGRGTLFFPDMRELGAAASIQVLEMLGGEPVGSAAARARIVFAHEPNWSVEHGVIGQLSEARVHDVSLPPLRERGRDILVLADHFAERARPAGAPPLGMTASASETLLAYDWPGNVDELRSAIQHAAAVCADSLIRVADLPATIVARARPVRDEGYAELKVQSLEHMGLSYISSVLDAVGGNKASAARLLGVDRTTLYRKLHRQEQTATPAVVEVPPAVPRTRK
jgi:DNA-binding NtrC family response regulator